MSHSIAEARATAPDSTAIAAGFRWAPVFLSAAFVFLWLEIIHQLQNEWSLNPQYSYGWTVPFLAGYLFFQRWRERPAPEQSAFPRLTSSLIVLATALLFPLRLVAVANPDWRLLDWLMALSAVVISLGALQLIGGPRWLRHFVFPILFFLVAVPWPVQLEQFVVQNLMRADAAITIGILNFSGTLALQHGNVIELQTGQVGIDDACTGVRSLQATFMLALFLGAFYRLTKSRRLLLVLAGAALAFLCNIGRTFILCEVAANSGIAAIQRWHDPAGYTILVICLFLLWGLTLFLQPARGLPVVSPNERSFPAVRLGWPLALVLYLCFTEASVAAWYARNPANASSLSWTIIWPNDQPNFHRQPISTGAEELLHYNEGGAATWRSADARPWLLYSFHWLPGRTAALFVKNHRPDICLPASGLTMEKESATRLINLNGFALPLRFYRFNDNGRPLHIVYCYSDGRAITNSEDWSARGRLRAAWAGERERGARMFELAVWNFENDGEATAALTQELAAIIRRE